MPRISLLAPSLNLQTKYSHVTLLGCLGPAGSEGGAKAAGLTACWTPGWCPRASVFRPERDLVSRDCWPETE